MQKTSIRFACLSACSAALLLAGCSSLPSGDVPIVDRTTPTSGGAANVESSGAVTTFGGLRDSGRTHTVTVGDTIYNISVRYGVTTQDLMQLNAVADPTQLAIGRVLHIPQSTTTPREVTIPAGVRVNRIEQGAPIEEAHVTPGAGAAAAADDEPKTAEITEAAATPTAPVESKAEAAKPAPTVKAEPAVIPGTRMLWPVRGKILSNYAQNGKGLDISAPTGSVVVSAGAGEVIFVGSGVKGYGQLVIVRHQATLVTAYGHNSKIVVKMGDKVKAGQKIAEIGSTDAAEPMLRFEVRDKGQPVDPMKYLPPQRN